MAPSSPSMPRLGRSAGSTSSRISRSSHKPPRHRSWSTARSSPTAPARHAPTASFRRMTRKPEKNSGSSITRPRKVSPAATRGARFQPKNGSLAPGASPVPTTPSANCSIGASPIRSHGPGGSATAISTRCRARRPRSSTVTRPWRSTSRPESSSGITSTCRATTGTSITSMSARLSAPPSTPIRPR